jgi:4'-phosphopantetheinyl transferase
MDKVYYLDITNINIDDINLSLVSNERIEKAKKYKNEAKKIQSLISYLLLRYVFKELDINLNEYEFSYQNNKPYIKDLNYHFNITHSKNIVAVVVGDKEVGVDVEFIDYERKLNSLNYVLSNVELSIYNQLNGNEKQEFFYRKWTTKEAYFKMRGIGLSKTFNSCMILEYPVYKIFDINQNPYYITSTIPNFSLLEVEFNLINE